MFEINKMYPFRIFLCASIFFVAGFAHIPSESVKFNIFYSGLRPFETTLSQHVNNYETKFKNGKDEAKLLVAIRNIVINILNMLDGDWKRKFLEASAGISNDTVGVVKKLVQDFYLKFSQFKQSKPERKTFGPMILQQLYNILQIFHAEDSYFRKYPLISSPLVIELALVAAIFDPISKGLGIESEVNKYRLPCLAYDLLFEYRAYAVDSRLDKLQVVLHRDDDLKLT